MSRNQAAWPVAKHSPLRVKDAPYPAPGPGEIVVENNAVAVNPVDWMKPYVGDLAFRWIEYPFVLGSDLAGKVVEVGSGVSDLHVGDRVLAMAAGACKQRNRGGRRVPGLYDRPATAGDPHSRGHVLRRRGRGAPWIGDGGLRIVSERSARA